jgi:site-specific DNA-methyltransferase (adenine-specific)
VKIEKMKIADLSPDPANARKHSDRNLDAIKASLRRFGQQKPIVVDGDGVVRAGNGTLAAAQALGWVEIDVVRTPLKGSEATAFAIADNRTAELAEWESEALAKELEALVAEGFPVADVGFDEEELKKLLGEVANEILAAGHDSSQIVERFEVLVTCTSERHQADLLGKLEAEGYECRALIS